MTHTTTIFANLNHNHEIHKTIKCAIWYLVHMITWKIRLTFEMKLQGLLPSVCPTFLPPMLLSKMIQRWWGYNTFLTQYSLIINGMPQELTQQDKCEVLPLQVMFSIRQEDRAVWEGLQKTFCLWVKATGLWTKSVMIKCHPA